MLGDGGEGRQPQWYWAEVGTGAGAFIFGRKQSFWETDKTESRTKPMRGNHH